tara:strand:+ start:436 stop:783 length:348 start_codon:yes stop_codon:yes gene_type:complete
MTERNKNRTTDVISILDEEYTEFFEKKDTNIIRHYKTPIFSKITKRQRRSLSKILHIWKTGDKLHKLAAKHYGNPRLWWIIAWYNMAPTEAHIKAGRKIYIPTPLERVYSVLRVF